jgi:pterin-4a-carbinolamine dehydratase
MNTSTEAKPSASELPSAETLANKHCKANVKEVEPTWLCEAVGYALPEWKILVENIEPEATTKVVADEQKADQLVEPETEQKSDEQSSDELAKESSQESTFKAARAIALERTFTFDNYFQTLNFVNSIASMIHREDHHPQLTVTFNRCVVRWDTHTVKGVSLNDLICAAKCDFVFNAAAHTRAK